MIDINKLKGERAIIFLFLLVALIVPGIGIIYLKDSNLLPNLDFYRILSLSIFYSMPTFFINYILSLFLYPKMFGNQDVKDRSLNILYLTSYLSIGFFYVSYYFFSPGISALIKIDIVTSIYLGVVISCIIGGGIILIMHKLITKRKKVKKSRLR